MNARRLMVSWLAVGAIGVRLSALKIALKAIVAPVKLAFDFVQRRRVQRLEGLKGVIGSFKMRGESFIAECRSLPETNPFANELRRRQLETTRSALLAEATRINSVAQDLNSPNPIRAVLAQMLESMRRRSSNIKRKQEALVTIISQVETAPNYCWSLLLWFFLPGGSIEEQMGDLSEELDLRTAFDGEALANAWYRREVFRSVRDRLWAKIERLAAIGTLIDFLIRWLKN
jgi:hypothetical protein